MVSGSIAVIKLGGRAFDGPDAIATFARRLAAHHGRAVIVHGGGAEVSAWCERLGLPASFVDGLRVTDENTLEVATAVLAGLANKRLVARMRAAGVDAVGLSALDGGLAQVAPHADTGRLGHVGAVERVDSSLIAMLLAQGRVPVVASIGACDGALLNLNADDVAGALAAALGATLVLLSDTPGVKLGHNIVQDLTPHEATLLLAHPDVRGGMRPKLAAARDAVEAGAVLARITQWSESTSLASLLELAGPGTTVRSRTVAAASRTPSQPAGAAR